MDRKGLIIWLMGPTSAGKTTIAKEIANQLGKKKVLVIHYDGDEIRNLFGKDFGFTKENRFQVVHALIHLANRVADIGINVIVSALTANIDARKCIEKSIKNLIIVYIKCSIQECSKRDPKGLYKKAREGDIDSLIGYNTPYLPPEMADFIIDTEEYSISQCATKILVFISKICNI
jgi:adenylylsulfate kinase